MTRALQLSNSIAAEDITGPGILRDLIGIDEEAAEHVIRAFQNLNSACRGEQIGVTAVLTAMHNLREMCQDLYAKSIYDECAEIATEEHAEGMRGLRERMA